jgi:K+-transporting ATPase A subunit
VKPFGLYMVNVMEGRPIWPLRVGARFEQFIYRLCGIDPDAQMAGLAVQNFPSAASGIVVG